MTDAQTRNRLGHTLVAQGLLSQEELNSALAQQKSTGQMLGEMLVEQGVIRPAVLVRALGDQLGIQSCTLRHGLIDPQLLSLIGEEEAERLKAMPMFKVRQTLTVAMAEPQSLPKIDRLEHLTGCKINPVLALDDNINEFIKKYAAGDIDVDAFLASLSDSDVEVIERETVDDDATDLDNMVAGSPVVNLVNMAVLSAIHDRASDIHIEPSKQGTRIRYRIDGALRDLMKPPAGMHAAIVSRVKVIGKMNIAEKRVPQEGRVRIVAEGREIDLRVSSMPTLLGEKLVIRVLDKSVVSLDLDQIGLEDDHKEMIKELIAKPNGIIILTGPTGSGKTTTLYSILKEINEIGVKIITTEDPIEYEIEGINQVAINSAIGLTFARCLRSILRQDPDKIMVGEIRDLETAQIAVQSSLTGHLVFSTLHTNDAPGAITRLLDMGVEPFLVTSTLQAAIAQRLVRVICEKCKEEADLPASVCEQLGISEKDRKETKFYHGKGCDYCHGTGFHGRRAIFEVLLITDSIRELILRKAPTVEIKQKAKEIGLRLLREDAVLKLLDGLTSAEEVLRET